MVATRPRFLAGAVALCALSCGGYYDDEPLGAGAAVESARFAVESTEHRSPESVGAIWIDGVWQGDPRGRCVGRFRGCVPIAADGTFTLRNACSGRWRIRAALYDGERPECGESGEPPEGATQTCDGDGPSGDVFIGPTSTPVSLVCQPAATGASFDVQIL